MFLCLLILANTATIGMPPSPSNPADGSKHFRRELSMPDVRVLGISQGFLTGNGECLQYSAVLMRQRPSPRGSPSAAPSRGSSRREKPPPLQRDGEMTGVGERRRKTAEDKNSLVYAALNHQPLEAAASSRPRRPKEENSEYAAIRVS